MIKRVASFLTWNDLKRHSLEPLSQEVDHFDSTYAIQIKCMDNLPINHTSYISLYSHYLIKWDSNWLENNKSLIWIVNFMEAMNDAGQWCSNND